MTEKLRDGIKGTKDFYSLRLREIKENFGSPFFLIIGLYVILQTERYSQPAKWRLDLVFYLSFKHFFIASKQSFVSFHDNGNLKPPSPQ